MFTYQPFARQYFNSLYIALAVTALTLVFSSLAGYALARMRFAGAGLLMLFLVSALMVPEEVTIIPNFFLMRWLGLMDTHWPLILLPVFGPQGIMATFLMRQYFLALPKELEEAGKMDGLSRLGIWWRIALPMSRPALAAVAIITFLNSWNLFLEPLVFVSSLEMFTLPLALSNFTDPYGMPLWHLQLAATSLAVRADPDRLPDRPAADHRELRALRASRAETRHDAALTPQRHPQALRHGRGHPRRSISTSRTASSRLRRPLGLRQVHAAADDRRARGHHRGRALRSASGVMNDVQAAKRGVAMVFQSYALYPHLDVRDNMGFGLKVRERAGRRARAAASTRPRRR